jgi:hypothetical protein
MIYFLLLKLFDLSTIFFHRWEQSAKLQQLEIRVTALQEEVEQMKTQLEEKHIIKKKTVYTRLSKRLTKLFHKLLPATTPQK